MFKSEYAANVELSKVNPAYKNISLDGSIARQALRNYYASQPKGLARIVAKITKFFI
jgi:hypothetical protein